MDYEELVNIKQDRLEKKRKEFKEELANLRMQKAVTTLENPMRMKTVRRTIARINTILRQRELEEERSNE